MSGAPTTRYRSDGFGRDAYINEQIRKPTKISNLAQRRDTLPDNVFRYLKEQVCVYFMWEVWFLLSSKLKPTQQVHREEYSDYVRDLQTLGSKVRRTAGKRMIPRERELMQEEARMQSLETKYFRQQKLQLLYQQEQAQWDAELNEKGLTIARNRE